MTRRIVLSVFLLVGCASGFAPLHAHPTPATSVTITIGGARANVTLISRGSALASMLEALADVAPSPRDEDAVARITQRAASFARHSAFFADGGSVPLTFVRAERLEDGSDRVSVTLSATLPAATSTIAWRTALVVGAYPLFVQGAGSPEVTDGTAVTEWVNGPQLSRTFGVEDLDRSRDGHWPLVWVGLTHIVPNGTDHILFVVGLCLLARSTRQLLAQITAFTVAHSVTLGFAAAGVVTLPAFVVEPLIALSIVYIALENLVAAPLSRWRLAVVFAFGLLHGLGFADALSSLLPSTGTLLLSLVAFNVGVELGQLVVVAATIAVFLLVSRTGADTQRLIARPASLVIGGAGVLWTLERLISGT